MENISLALVIKRDRESVFTEDLLLQESDAAESTLPLPTSVSFLMEVSRLGGSKGIVKMLCSKF